MNKKATMAKKEEVRIKKREKKLEEKVAGRWCGSLQGL